MEWFYGILLTLYFPQIVNHDILKKYICIFSNIKSYEGGGIVTMTYIYIQTKRVYER